MDTLLQSSQLVQAPAPNKLHTTSAAPIPSELPSDIVSIIDSLDSYAPYTSPTSAFPPFTCTPNRPHHPSHTTHNPPSHITHPSTHYSISPPPPSTFSAPPVTPPRTSRLPQQPYIFLQTAGPSYQHQHHPYQPPTYPLLRSRVCDGISHWM